MINKLTLKNFKSVGLEEYDFRQFDLIVGRNNSGKSTILQALAIWQFCMDTFHLSNRKGTAAVQVVLPNFTALPLPEFNLLWKDKTDRHWPTVNGEKKQEYILITIVLDWTDKNNEPQKFGVELRYHSPQTLYAKPMEGWSAFKKFDALGIFPKIAYVPPFSGLEPSEEWRDDGPLRIQVGKAQPGSVLRNLLHRVYPASTVNNDIKKRNWLEIEDIIKKWFGLTLVRPQYKAGVDTQIKVQYKNGTKEFDIISGGSGFHQILTLLAFLHAYEPTTILLDEPDAHLHANLQRQVLDYFKQKSNETKTQFIIATHAEEFIKGVDSSQILSLLNKKPKRLSYSAPSLLRALADIPNEEIIRLQQNPYIVFVEGESDERIIRAWTDKTKNKAEIDNVYFKTMNGGDKKLMLEWSKKYMQSIKEIIPETTNVTLFDYDSNEKAFHPSVDNFSLAEWKRKNIESYMLIPDAWKRAALNSLISTDIDLFTQKINNCIDDFFASENLTLPPNATWKNLKANIFSNVDGKRILFENDNSLFHQLTSIKFDLNLIRENIALNMLPSEKHEDIDDFLAKIAKLTTSN